MHKNQIINKIKNSILCVPEKKEGRRRCTLITIDTKSKRVEYSFSNGTVEEYSAGEYARYQCNRYWVERSFDDGSSFLR